jgi:hypothetical protein
VTNRSEHNLTEIVDRLAQKWAADHEPPVEWENLDMVQRQRIKQELLPTVMLVLNITDEVDAERSTEENVEAEGERALTGFLGQDEEDSYKIGFRDGWRRAMIR